MITFMRRYREGLQVGLLVVIAAFVASLFVFGSSGFDGRAASATDAVATVNGETISRRQYQDRYQGYLEMYSRGNQRPAHARAGRAAGPAPARGGRAGHRGGRRAARARPRGWGSATRSSTPPSTPCASSRTTGASRWTVTAASCRSAAWRPSSELRRYLTMRKVQRLDRGRRARHRRRGRAGVGAAPRGGAGGVGDGRAGAAGRGGHRQRRGGRRVPQGRTPRSSSSPSAARCSTSRWSPKDFAPQGERRRGREVLHRAHQGVRDAAPGARPATCWCAWARPAAARPRTAPARKIADGDQARQGAARTSASSPARCRRIRAPRTRAATSGWVSTGTMVPRVRAGAVRAQEGRDQRRARAHAVRLPRHQGHSTSARPRASRSRRSPPQIRDRLAAEAGDRAARAKADEVRPALQAKAGDFMAEARKLGLTPIETTMSKLGAPARHAAATAGGGRVRPRAWAACPPPVKTPAGWVVLKVVETIPPGVPPLARSATA